MKSLKLTLSITSPLRVQFSLLTALNTAFLILIVLYTMGPSEVERENNKFVSRMQEFAKHYNWDHKQDDATETWDVVQRLHCCGISGPNDWDKVRPSDIPSDKYPSSCCLSSDPDYPFIRKDLCGSKDEIFKTGCLERVQDLEAFYLLLQCIFIAFQMGLCIIGCVVGNFTLGANRDNSAFNSTINARGLSQQQPPPQGYQRFTGSLYVRQPPIAPPLYYPDAHSVEKTAYNAPPPSYGTVI